MNIVVSELIRVNNLKKAYFQTGNPIWALKGIDLVVKPGEFIGIVGKSGAGKTTLINMIAGLDLVTEGQVWVAEAAIHRMDEDSLARWRSNQVGIVYQNFYLMPKLSLLENVMLPMDFADIYHPIKSKERARYLLEMMGLADHVDKPPSAVSGGQQQRVAIARALANDPAIILADEPTGRLDSHTASTIFNLFIELHKKGKTILMVTHDPTQVSLFSRVMLLENGLIKEFHSHRVKNE